MRPCRSVLLVEDEEDQVGTWKAEFREFNENDAKPFRVALCAAANLSEARGILRKHYVNAAIVDLRIPAGPDGDLGPDSGNVALQEIIETISGPIAVFSAHIGEAAEFVARTPIRLFTKEAEQVQGVMDWLCQHAPLMAAVDQASLDIRRETARIFAGMIWPRWNETKELNLSEDVLRKVVTRQVVSYIAEQLSLPLNDAPAYHPYEFYFEPPLRQDRMHTGDLICFDDDIYVILTPQCDMVRQYPERVLLAKCKELGGWERMRATDKRKYATQGHALKSHFLPACGVRGPWLVDFNCLITVDGAALESLRSKRFASIAPQFVPNLIQRFSAFIGRIGQPDLDV